MLTGMTEQDWLIALEVFVAVQSSRGEPGHDDRKFLEAIHYFTVHSITWRALPKEFGNWNSVWKRFWRLSRSGVFEAFFQMLAECSETAHLIQFFDSTTARAHVSAAGAKGLMGLRYQSIVLRTSLSSSCTRYRHLGRRRGTDQLDQLAQILCIPSPEAACSGAGGVTILAPLVAQRSCPPV